MQDLAFVLSEFQNVPVGPFLHLSSGLDTDAKQVRSKADPMYSSSAYRQLGPLPSKPD